MGSSEGVGATLGNGVDRYRSGLLALAEAETLISRRAGGAAHARPPAPRCTGDCYDNAVVESFFSTLEFELIAPRGAFGTRAEARRALLEYLDGFYNKTRLHSILGYLSPSTYERIHELRQAA